MWGAYNRASRLAVWPAKTYLVRPLPAAVLRLHQSTSTGVEEAGLEDDSLVYTGTLIYTSTPGVDDKVPV